MRIEEVPAREWAETLNEFTIAHEGWLVSMATFGSDVAPHTDIRPQTQIRNLPLIGVSVDFVDDHDGIAISVARSATEHITHVIQRATRIYLQRINDGASASLMVDCEEGTRTVIRARASALPSRK